MVMPVSSTTLHYTTPVIFSASRCRSNTLRVPEHIIPVIRSLKLPQSSQAQLIVLLNRLPILQLSIQVIRIHAPIRIIHGLGDTLSESLQQREAVVCMRSVVSVVGELEEEKFVAMGECAVGGAGCCYGGFGTAEEIDEDVP